MGELERAGVEDAAEDAAKEKEEAASQKKDGPPALDTSGDNVATTGAVETFRAEDSPPSVESPVPSEPELSPGGSLTGDGDGPARGGRIFTTEPKDNHKEYDCCFVSSMFMSVFHFSL